MKSKKKSNQPPKPQPSHPLTEAFGKLIPKSNLNSDLKHKVKEYIDKLNDSSTRENAFQSLKQIISKYTSLDQIKIILPLLTSYSSAVPSQIGREYQIILIAFAIKMGYVSNCDHSVLTKLLDVVTCYLSDNSINIHKGCSIVVIEIFDLIMKNENIESALGFIYRYFSNVVNKHHADVPKEENNGVVNGSFAIVNDIISYVITLYKERNTNNNNNAYCESVDMPSQQQNQPNENNNNNDNANDNSNKQEQQLHQIVPNELIQHLSSVLVDLLKLLKTYKFTNPNLLEGIAHLIDVVPYANYYNSLKSVIPQLIQILYSNNTQIYLSKIEACNIFYHLGLKTQSSPSITEDINVNDICSALSYAMKDRVVKVQVAASEALQCWNKKESESKERRVSRLNLLRNLSKINKEKNVVMSSVQVRKEVYDVGIGKFLRTASFISNREEEGLIKLKGLWEKKKKGERENSEENKGHESKERIRNDKKEWKGGNKEKFEMCAKQKWERKKEEEMEKEQRKEDEGKGKESRKGSGDNKRKEVIGFEEEVGIVGDNIANVEDVEGEINGDGEEGKESKYNENNKNDEGSEHHNEEIIEGDLKDDDMKGEDEINQDEQNEQEHQNKEEEEEINEEGNKSHKTNNEKSVSYEMDENNVEGEKNEVHKENENEHNDIDDKYFNNEDMNEHHSNKNESNANDNNPPESENIEEHESHKEEEFNEDDIDKLDDNDNAQLNAKEFSENEHQLINKEEEDINLHHSNNKHQSQHEEENNEQVFEEQKSYPQDIIPEEDENDEEQSINNEHPSLKPSQHSSQKVLLNKNKSSSKILFEEEQNIKADELGISHPPEEQNSFIINNNKNNNSIQKSPSQHSNISLHQNQKQKAYINKPIQEIDNTQPLNNNHIKKELAPIIKQKHSHKQQPKFDINPRNNNNITPLLNNLQSYFFSQLENTFSSFENQIHSSLSHLNTKLNNISSKLSTLNVQNPNTSALIHHHTSNINLLNNSTSSIKSQPKQIPPSNHTSHFSNNTSIPLWDLILSYINANNYTQAYTAALQSNDDLLLIRLLFLTGPQPLNQIPISLCKTLLLHLNAIYRCFMLHNLITDFIGEYIHISPLSNLTLQELNELLQTLYEISFLSNATGNKAKTIYKEIKYKYNRINV